MSNIYIPSYDEAYEVSQGRGANSLAPEQHQGLVGAWLLNEKDGDNVRDLSGYGKIATRAGTGANNFINSPRGIVGEFNGSDDKFTTAGASEHLQTPDNFSLSCWVNPESFLQSHMAPFVQGLITSNYNYGFALRNNGTLRVALHGRFQIAVALYASGAEALAAGWFWVGITYDGSTCKIFHNGREVHTGSYTYPDGSSTADFNIGGSTDYYYDGQISDVRVWNVVKPPRDMLDVYNNPWDAWTLRRKTTVYVTAAAADYSIDANAGTYTVTGTASGLEHDKTVTCGSGAYTVTGTAATLLHDKQLTCSSGTYTIAGTQASLLHDKQIVCGAGTYTITGTAATLDYAAGAEIDAGTGTYTITGTAATLLHDKVIVPGAGTYTITGTAATLQYGATLDVAAGTYAVTGTAATFDRTYVITCGSGTFTITGTAAGLEHDKTISIGSGTYTVTGTAATLSAGVAITAGSGTYSIAGTAITFGGSSIIEAATGTYTISGSAATLQVTGAVVIGLITLPLDSELDRTVLLDSPLIISPELRSVLGSS